MSPKAQKNGKKKGYWESLDKDGDRRIIDGIIAWRGGAVGAGRRGRNWSARRSVAGARRSGSPRIGAGLCNKA